MKIKQVLMLLLAVCFNLGVNDSQAADMPAIGDVNFPISCSQSSQKAFNHATALLHHMMYIQAENEFTTITEKDPACAMAYWGIAISQIHPLWSAIPSKAEFAKGNEALIKAETVESVSKREKDYITALKPLYHNWQTTPYKQLIRSWEKTQKKLYQQYPDDPDAVAFYALAHIAIAPKQDKTYSKQREAGLILEKLHQQFPQHPGGFHYLIHAYDNPVLAARAEQVARDYGKIAPEVPHALHMPSHIFVRLGFWDETIDWNIRSAAAAKSQPLPNNVMSMHYAHAIDYLVYAYLQQAQDQKAKEMLVALANVQQFQDTFPTAYGFNAARARYALERKQWREAAKLPVNLFANFPLEKYPSNEALIYFAQGLGAAKTSQFAMANTALKHLNQRHQQLVKANKPYWATLVDAQRKTVQAWIWLQQNKKKQAVRMMRKAADIEDSVDKHPVTPSAVLPARELLGDMLIQLNRPAEALKAYQAALKISPNRLHSLYGVAYSAELLGKRAIAADYYQKVITLTKRADTKRPERKHAKQFLKTKRD